MIVGTYLASVVLFSLAFFFTRISRTISQVLSISRDSFLTITDSGLDDDAKEKAVQRAAIDMLRQFGCLLFKVAAIGLATLMPPFVADAANLASFKDISSFSLRWDVLLVTTIAAIAVSVMWRGFTSRMPNSSG